MLSSTHQLFKDVESICSKNGYAMYFGKSLASPIIVKSKASNEYGFIIATKESLEGKNIIEIESIIKKCKSWEDLALSYNQTGFIRLYSNSINFATTTNLFNFEPHILTKFMNLDATKLEEILLTMIMENLNGDQQ